MTLVGQVRFSFSSHCLHSFEACHQKLYLFHQYLLVNIISLKVIIKSSVLGKNPEFKPQKAVGGVKEGVAFVLPGSSYPGEWKGASQALSQTLGLHPKFLHSVSPRAEAGEAPEVLFSSTGYRADLVSTFKIV